MRLLRSALLGVLALGLLGVRARADDSSDYSDAEAAFRAKLDAQAFSGARSLGSGKLLLDATSVFISTPAATQAAWVRKAGADWLGALGEEAPSRTALLAVVTEQGGDLWRVDASSAQRVDRWSDDSLPFAPQENQRGRLFAFFGGQLVTGGGNGSTGINGRLGSTFFRNRFDFSVTLGYNNVDALSTSVFTYGVVGRALFPIDSKLGWNLGAQLIESQPSQGNSTSVVSVLGGLNFYLPGGSFDVTAQLGNNSTYGILAGYTFYLTRK